jgi:RNase adaptor protein for sRNA GlmZ degradation
VVVAMAGSGGTQAAAVITSFGYRHGAAPDAELTFDVRTRLRDPHVDPALRELTGEDEAVADAVIRTPGAGPLIGAIVAAVRACLQDPGAGPVTVAVGCQGGRHRSAVIAIKVADRLAWAGVPVRLVHRDLRRPVLAPSGAPADQPDAARPCAGTPAGRR